MAFYNLGEDYWPSYQIAHATFIKKLENAGNDKYPLVYLQTVDPSNPTFWNQTKLEIYPEFYNLRQDEYNSISMTADDGQDFAAFYSRYEAIKAESIINIIRTIFLCVVLAISSVYFTKDA